MRSTGFSGIVKRKSDMASALILAVLFLLPAPLMSAVDEGVARPELKSVFSPAEVTIGDRIFYTLTVTHEPGDTVAFTLPDSTRLLPYVLIGKEVKRSGRLKTEFRMELALFAVGKHALPPVRVHDVSGVKNARHARPADSVSVRALTDSSMTTLLPIKPLKQPVRSWTDYLFPLFAGAAVLALVVLVGYYVKRKTVSASGRLDSARDVLEKIRKLGKKLEKGLTPEECYEQLSVLIRRYLEGKYRIKALEEVTSEIEEELANCSVPRGGILIELLNQADLVKFAESRPTIEECRMSLGKAAKTIAFQKSSAAFHDRNKPLKVAAEPRRKNTVHDRIEKSMKP